MKLKLSESWRSVLNDEFEKDYFKNLVDFLSIEYQRNTCFPKQDEIFAAFNHCSFEDIKVVIIGQDPYHGENQANGLCFSVHDTIKHPPSLINIFKELTSDIGKPYPVCGNLEAWADQGVLLLNATLTVRKGEAGSHQKQGWEQFTDMVIQKISEQKEAVIFLLWGGFAKKKGAKIDQKKHIILTSGHPSPLSANRGFWFDNKHFSKTNDCLNRMAKQEIVW